MTETPSTRVGTGHIAVIRFFGGRFSLRLHRRGLLIGFAAGSYTGALIVILFLSGGYYDVAAGR